MKFSFVPNGLVTEYRPVYGALHNLNKKFE